MMDGGMDWCGGAMVLGWLVGVAALVLLILGVVWLATRLFDGERRRLSPDNGHTALRDTELRYARGDIDRETFINMREDLRRDTRGRPSSS